LNPDPQLIYLTLAGVSGTIVAILGGQLFSLSIQLSEHLIGMPMFAHGALLATRTADDLVDQANREMERVRHEIDDHSEDVDWAKGRAAELRSLQRQIEKLKGETHGHQERGARVLLGYRELSRLVPVGVALLAILAVVGLLVPLMLLGRGNRDAGDARLVLWLTAYFIWLTIVFLWRVVAGSRRVAAKVVRALMDERLDVDQYVLETRFLLLDLVAVVMAGGGAALLLAGIYGLPST
jgi:hypothetical protein